MGLFEHGICMGVPCSIFYLQWFVWFVCSVCLYIWVFYFVLGALHSPPYIYNPPMVRIPVSPYVPVLPCLFLTVHLALHVCGHCLEGRYHACCLPPAFHGDLDTCCCSCMCSLSQVHLKTQLLSLCIASNNLCCVSDAYLQVCISCVEMHTHTACNSISPLSVSSVKLPTVFTFPAIDLFTYLLCSTTPVWHLHFNIICWKSLQNNLNFLYLFLLQR